MLTQAQMSQSQEFQVTAKEVGRGGFTPIRLWLVDDNQRLRETLADLLAQEEGIQCTGTFPSPNAVLSALASRVGPDIILLDINMGPANGIEAISSIKSLSRQTHVVMFTTFPDDQAEMRALEMGASSFLLKSFPVDRILGVIRELSRRSPPPTHRRFCRNGGAINLESEPKSESREESVGPMPARMRPGAKVSWEGLVWIKRCLDLIRNSRDQAN